jgi:UDP-N-acetylmuramoyl-tripeptide--D-alanyl-D-alanine ligase
MGSLEGVAHTKGAIYTALPHGGTAVINADDAFAGYFAGLAANKRSLRFGLDHPADVTARGNGRLDVQTPNGSFAVTLPLPGRHNVLNALAATALALAAGAPLEAIRAGLEAAPNVAGRLTRHALGGGFTLIDDAYNANPGSVAAAIDTLALERGTRWLVLGNMAELGPDARALHAQTGLRAKQAGLDALWTVGALAEAASEAFGKGARHFPDKAALAKALLAAPRPAALTVLVKGSRSSAMEEIVAALLRHAGDAHGAGHAA